MVAVIRPFTDYDDAIGSIAAPRPPRLKAERWSRDGNIALSGQDICVAGCGSMPPPLLPRTRRSAATQSGIGRRPPDDAAALPGTVTTAGVPYFRYAVLLLTAPRGCSSPPSRRAGAGFRDRHGPVMFQSGAAGASDGSALMCYLRRTSCR